MTERPYHSIAAFIGAYAIAFPAIAMGAQDRNLLNRHFQSQPVIAQAEAAPGIERLETAPGSNTITPDSSANTPLTEVDLTGFWYHIRHNRLDMARQELERLQSEHPGWQPPPEPMQTLKRLILKRDLLAGKQLSGDELRSLMRDLTACEDPETAWLPVDRKLIAAEILPGMISRCTDANIATGSLSRYLERLSDFTRAAEIARLRRQLSGSPVALKYLDDAAFAYETKMLGALPATRAGEADARRLMEYAVAVRKMRSANGAEILGWLYLNRTEPEKALAWFEQAKFWGGKNAANEGMTLALSRKTADAAAAGNIETALSAARRNAAAGNGEAMETLGWILLNSQRPADAFTAFTEAPSTENVIYGRLLALRSAGEAGKAEQLACASAAMSKRLKQACDDTLVEHMLAAYKARRFDQVLELAGRIGILNGQRPDLLPVVAWSHLRNGDAVSAAELFESLYLARRDPDLAIGLLESLETANDQRRLMVLRNEDPIIGNVLKQRERQVALARKQFDLAGRLKPDAAPLNGRAAWAFSTGIETRAVEGKKGQGQILVRAPHIAAQGMMGDVRLDISLAKVRLDAGTASPVEDIGSRPSPDIRPPLARQDVVVPKISARLEQQKSNLSAVLSSTPLGAAVSARPVGALDATFYKDAYIITGGIFSQPVTSSMLSFAGTRDPATGQTWGRVVDSGAALQIIWVPSGPWSIAAKGEAAILDGQNVANNSRFGLRADLAHNFAPAGLDYLRAGPFISWNTYDRNLSQYTLGHGGYYSPQSDVRGGFLIDGLTEEGRKWQLRATASVAYGRSREEATPRFPLTPELGGQFDKTVSTGISGDLAMRGAVLVSPNLIVGGFANYSAAPKYGAGVLGLRFQIPLQRRSAVVSADLPENTLGFRR